MPLSGGTSGAHDDAMHQGNAKRDVNGGVAGLNSGGQILATGNSLILTRDGANVMQIKERTSGHNAFRFEYLGPNDFIGYIITGGAAQILQHEADKDVANGIAALDAAGALLVPGSKIYYTRDGSDDVHIYERTSGEEAYAFHRVGADDYTMYVKESNVWKQMQTESMKDIANGIAGLDANVLLLPALLPPCLEEYSNHLGAVDNFTQTVTGGNGTANTDVANHEMDLSSGVTVVGHASFRTKASWALGAKPIVFNGLVQNSVVGAGGVRWKKIGLAASWTSGEQNDTVAIEYNSAVGWFAITDIGGTDTVTNISDLVSGDFITIVATSTKVRFFVNGVIVATHTTNIPTNAMVAGMGCGSAGVTATTAISMSADMIGMKRYV